MLIKQTRRWVKGKRRKREGRGGREGHMDLFTTTFVQYPTIQNNWGRGSCEQSKCIDISEVLHGSHTCLLCQKGAAPVWPTCFASLCCMFPSPGVFPLASYLRRCSFYYTHGNPSKLPKWKIIYSEGEKGERKSVWRREERGGEDDICCNTLLSVTYAEAELKFQDTKMMVHNIHGYV